jgi:hypothetical protein
MHVDNLESRAISNQPQCEAWADAPTASKRTEHSRLFEALHVNAGLVQGCNKLYNGPLASPFNRENHFVRNAVLAECKRRRNRGTWGTTSSGIEPRDDLNDCDLALSRHAPATWGSTFAHQADHGTNPSVRLK